MNYIKTFNLHAVIMEFWLVLLVPTVIETGNTIFCALIFLTKSLQTVNQVITQMWVYHGLKLTQKICT